MTFVQSSVSIRNQNAFCAGVILRVSLASALLCCCPVIRAADTIQPLNLKLGLWETTSTREMTGQMPIPQEAREAMAKMREELAKMPPEQRAKIEAMLNANASKIEKMAKTNGTEAQKPTVRRTCVKKQDLDNLFKPGEIAESCTRTFLFSSSSRQEMRLQCAEQKGMKQTASVRIEAVNPETVKGSMQMSTTDGTQTMSMNSSFSAKWIGPACESKE